MVKTAKVTYFALWAAILYYLFLLLPKDQAIVGAVMIYVLTFFKAMVEHGDLWGELNKVKNAAIEMMAEQQAKIDQLESRLANK